MSLEAYAQGTIKVVWIEDDLDRIYSKMFKTEAEAEAFAQSKSDYLIFSLIKQERMEEFSWELLPYGRAPLYHRLLKAYRKHKDKGFFLKVVDKLL